jgi:hypothetical protein
MLLRDGFSSELSFGSFLLTFGTNGVASTSPPLRTHRRRYQHQTDSCRSLVNLILVYPHPLGHRVVLKIFFKHFLQVPSELPPFEVGGCFKRRKLRPI